MVEADEGAESGASVGLWTLLIVTSAISFWIQAVVTEERFVPALNVVADYFRIPNDIAGATLMAAGASSPELFSSIVALFITHSALGLGTIVGSEVFNQLIICAGAVYASKNGNLQLDRTIVIREVFFYSLAVCLLYIALQDSRPVEGDDENHIFISFAEACMLFSGYILYVLVCANMDFVVGVFNSSGRSLRDGISGEKVSYGALGKTKSKRIVVPEKIKYVTEKKVLSHEPAENWKGTDFFKSAVLFDEDEEEDADGSFSQRQLSPSQRRTENFLAMSLRDLDLMKRSERPTDFHAMHDVGFNAMSSEYSCFMWQQSIFYNRAYFGSKAWHLRWFSISPEAIVSVPDRTDPEKHTLKYPRFHEIEIDEDHLLIKIINPDPSGRAYTLMAPSKPIFDQVVVKFEAFMEHDTSKDTADQLQSAEASDDFENADPHVGLIEFPTDASNVAIVFWVLLFPFRFLLHCTVPDVRVLDQNGNPTGSIGIAGVACMMCLVWLIIGSYAMVASLEKIAELLDIPDSVVGVTVSAAGTSLPNYIASKVAAQNGFGNQAVSNAFGSNTFNIMIGLGLPWVLYTSFGTNFEPYSGLRDDGIGQSIVILAGFLLLFIVLMLCTGFVIHKWHGHLFIFLYIGYLGFSIGQVYL
mmetsp:Transcript_10960/g.30285  ORF Transcript_10960/g.30285 Transcript_10960/m.30285 type:complete len:642 (-) Transcript_10960:85-2010(-)|eukprot:CAMPEP_0198119066 /NCGR_PEP_ID=MMETSP1442-20131203/24175_1 /TAXON_ID= /ORGANISM="Craspedostauros australis, Strain CCMP3328" /LENGTH=641 /DNA_ID=CAMNT_0043777453 /DNA_START=131 /DNA_END=2056 /DNA_ORIENTATION=-